MERNVEVRKHKGEEYDIYACRECGRVWKSSAKRIGHKKSSCDAYYRKHG